MNDTDQILKGTVWIRAKGKHGESVGTIDSFNTHGPRLKLTDGSHRRLSWSELGFGWEPADTRSEKQHNLWKAASHIEYLDRIIEGDTMVVNGLEKLETSEVSVKECHGAWHRHAGKKGEPASYDLIPLTEFDIAAAGPNKGQLAAVCRECNKKNQKSPSHRPKSTRKITLRKVDQLVIDSGVETPTGTIYRWRIVVVQETEHFVQAKDFLDAAAQVSGLGEITHVDKL